VHKGIFLSEFIVIGLSALAIALLIGFDTDIILRSSGYSGAGLLAKDQTLVTNGGKIFGCIIIGLVAGELIGQFTEYCTDFSKSPTQGIAKASNTGPATVIIQGLGVGMISVTVPALVLVVAIIATDRLAALYGVAIAAVGMLSTLGVTLATDAYGPVADNAGGIAEMCSAELPKKTREYTDALDAMGNTTAATGKGFAIGSAVLTAAALMAAFMNACGVYEVNVRNPLVICGMLIGAMLPYVFAAITMLSVGQSAQDIMQDVRDQFKDKNELKVDARYLEERREHYEDLEEEDAAGNAAEMQKIRSEMDVIYKKYLDNREKLPDYDHTIKIATNAALNEMMIPGALAIFTPAAVGFLLGPAALAGLLIGALTSGFMLAIEMANAGGAWDNAKKWVEGGELKFCNEAYKKSTPYHDATVVGDTVGDPFKDTSGPALNVLIKLMTLVSLVLAPAFKNIYDPDLKTTGFERDGVIAGIIIIVVVGGFCYYWQKRSDAKNAKPETKQTHSAAYWKAVKTVNQLLDDVSIEGFDAKLKAAIADVKDAKWADGKPDLDSGSAGVVAASNLDASLSSKTA